MPLTESLPHASPGSPSSPPDPSSPEHEIPSEKRPETEVFAIFGADPEVLAYAMAKYSRSSLSMKESLREISSQRAEQFLNTFYFQYGHRSIADLAHVAFAVERLSLLAAIVLVDEQRWDGQERSTRYQNFVKSGWHLPDFGTEVASRELYTQTVEDLFVAYRAASDAVFASLRQQTTKPEEMKPEQFDRTLKARAFDVARYLLPLATNTSLGQIVNARTLETQISRLLSQPHAEIRELGRRLRDAAAAPAWNVNGAAMEQLRQEIGATDPQLAERAAALLTRDVKTAPTLVKYAAVNQYDVTTREELRQAAASLMKDTAIDRASLVDLVERGESLELEIAATLLYSVSHYSYRQLRRHVAELNEAALVEIIDIGVRHRGRHDELLREFSAGQSFRFDILMDIGGFRDMHRHRKCTQILQPFTRLHGYQVPDGIAEAGFMNKYRDTVETAHEAFDTLAGRGTPEAAATAQYLLPLATRNRSLFKMDFAEALYIAELRSTPAGHFSYRKVAWEMYLAVQRQHPGLAKYFRIRDVNEPVDILQR